MLHASGHSSCHKDSLICPHARNVVLMHAAQARLWVMCCVLGDSNRCAQHCVLSCIRETTGCGKATQQVCHANIALPPISATHDVPQSLMQWSGRRLQVLAKLWWSAMLGWLACLIGFFRPAGTQT